MNGTRRPSVGVVVLNHNGRLLAERCLSSVVRAGYPGTDLIVVDNDLNAVFKLTPDPANPGVF